MTNAASPGAERLRSEGNTEPIAISAGDGSADELKLLPPDCPSRDEFLQQVDPVAVIEPAVPAPPPRFQFSLIDLMVVTFGVAMGLAGGTWMPSDYFAGILGLLVLLGLILVTYFPLESHWARLAWGTFILAYVVALVAALFRPPSA